MYVWPLCIFPPKSVRWSLRSVTIGGGVSVGGISPNARTDGGGLWVCEMSGVWLHSDEQLKEARAAEGRLDGGLTKIIVPDRDFHLGPRPKGVHWPIEVFAGSIALLRATEVVIDFTNGAPATGGEHFSVAHPTAGKRMYRVIEVVSRTATQQTVKIRPPLREAISAGEALDYNHPGCTMRLANPDDFFGAIENARTADLSPTFVEAF